MKKKFFIAIALLIFISESKSGEPTINSVKAPFYVGRTVMACGILAQTKHLSGKHYLNFDKKFPNHSLAIMIWDNNFQNFTERLGNIDSYVGRRFCARGQIKEYKGNLEMTLSNPQFLRLMSN